MINSFHLTDKLLHIIKEYTGVMVIDEIHVDSMFPHD